MGSIIEAEISATLKRIDDELHNVNINLIELIKAVHSISEDNKIKKEVNTHEQK